MKMKRNNYPHGSTSGSGSRGGGCGIARLGAGGQREGLEVAPLLRAAGVAGPNVNCAGGRLQRRDRVSPHLPPPAADRV